MSIIQITLSLECVETYFYQFNQISFESLVLDSYLWSTEFILLLEDLFRTDLCNLNVCDFLLLFWSCWSDLILSTNTADFSIF